MKPSVKFPALLIVALCATVTFPQFASAQTATPNAYVYVINRLPNSVELDGLSADSTGGLTPLPGSPFWTSTTASVYRTLAHSANWLFLADDFKIYSFSIASNGTLTLKSSINAGQFAPSGSDRILALFLDRTWSTLYATEYADSPQQGPNAILAFKKNGTTGALTYLGSTDYPNFQYSPGYIPAFLGNNQYAYNGYCDGAGVGWFAGHRNSDGTLDRFPINPPIPSNPNGTYCPYGDDAADPANNLAVALLLGQNGPLQLAVYTADSSGNLMTNSTAANMPTSAVRPFRMAVSPAGNLLAVCGGGGLQVFHFNGSNPITPYTKRLAEGCRDLAWDTHNHLYITEGGSKGMRAWRITPNFWTAAPPYPLSSPYLLAVVSK
ncbi:MAG: hypothetical protein DMG96_28925 [Acidobacteria bacterium]|nr:MAG: hypothetical protein DMG96_28925 [Acidobacteriota bacterium]